MAKKSTGSSTPKKKKTTKGKKAQGLNSTAFLKKDLKGLSAQTLKKHYALAETARLHYEAQMLKSGAVGFTKPGTSGIAQVVVYDSELQQGYLSLLQPFAEHRDKVLEALKKQGWKLIYQEGGYKWFNFKKK